MQINFQFLIKSKLEAPSRKWMSIIATPSHLFPFQANFPSSLAGLQAARTKGHFLWLTLKSPFSWAWNRHWGLVKAFYATCLISFGPNRGQSLVAAFAHGLPCNGVKFISEPKIEVSKTCFENTCCIFGNEDGRPKRICAMNHVVPSRALDLWKRSSHIVLLLLQGDWNCAICLVWIKCFTATAIQQPPKSFDSIAKVKSATKGGCMKHLKGAMRCKIHLKRLEYNFTA